MSEVPSTAATAPAPQAAPIPAPQPITRRQGTALIALLAAVLAVGALLAYFALTNGCDSKTADAVKRLAAPKKYEYKTVDFYTSSPKREGGGAFKYTSVDVDTAQLNKLGSGGWEVVGSYLEMETAWANFGSAKYVTGLQPNVRPQRLVLVLRRLME
jgi:hypothetical protein